MSRLWVYPVASDTNAPGDYMRVDGYTLANEGASELYGIEEYSVAVEDLKACGFDCLFALVEELDEEFSVLDVQG